LFKIFLICSKFCNGQRHIAVTKNLGRRFSQINADKKGQILEICVNLRPIKLQHVVDQYKLKFKNKKDGPKARP
jgi:hypothetical protein